MVLLAKPLAVELSTWIGDLGCGHPISFNALRSGTMSWAHLNSAAVSASPADAYTDGRMVELDSTSPLDCGMGSSLDKKMCALDLLQ
jgi:hypothetical protein